MWLLARCLWLLSGLRSIHKNAERFGGFDACFSGSAHSELTVLSVSMQSVEIGVIGHGEAAAEAALRAPHSIEMGRGFIVPELVLPLELSMSLVIHTDISSQEEVWQFCVFMRQTPDPLSQPKDS